MPYINKTARQRIDPAIKDLAGRIESMGDLNYAITRLAVEKMNGGTQITYASMSAIHGVLADVAAEFYRRMMAPYEDTKLKEHGDVYQPYSKQSDK